MLTEGWDANTVTHILGIRAFGTQLLCEQVVGRALRRASYDADENGMFEPEYAEVYGVPFSFLSVAGKGRVKARSRFEPCERCPSERDLRIEFPRVIGYRYVMPTEHLEAAFDASSILQLSTQEVATKTELDPIVGLSEIHEVDLRDQRGPRLFSRLHIDHAREPCGNRAYGSQSFHTSRGTRHLDGAAQT